MKTDTNTEIQFLGDSAPLSAAKHSKQPERRQINRRWFVSSILVGATSLYLMGGALYAALDGRENLLVPAELLEQRLDNNRITKALKGNHPHLRAGIKNDGSDVMMVSTITRVDGLDVVKSKPFMKISGSLSAAPIANLDYPSFNPLAVFSESGSDVIIAKSSDFMYGADVEGEVSLSLVEFPYDEITTKDEPDQKTRDTTGRITSIVQSLKDNDSYVAALTYFTSNQSNLTNPLSGAGSEISITAENVSTHPKLRAVDYSGERYEERLVKIRSDVDMETIFATEGIGEQEASVVIEILSGDLGTDTFKTGDQIQAWFKIKRNQDGTEGKSVARLSLFRNAAHLVSIAKNDQQQFVYAIPPETAEEILADDDPIEIIASENLPRVYDGIYTAALTNGLPSELTSSLIKIFAFDVDFKSRVKLDDALEVFVSLEEGEETPTTGSEILYASIKIGSETRRYYRFRDAETGQLDYYDEAGKSAKKFLMRQPVPNGRFRSAFGMRRHPISGVYKLHAGVDWSAPRGTPILAAGSGVVTQAKWAGGYGRQTIIRHANGYETSYSHQTAFAKNAGVGTRVRQGQVIGYVGSTGYSTGPHLHYEVKVNGKRVDPMRIRLPKGKVLRGEELAAFESERDRINALVRGKENLELASN